MPNIVLKSKWKQTIYVGGIKQVVPITEIYMDDIYRMSYSMENKYLLPTYPAKALLAKSYAHLLHVIINLVKPVSCYRGSCEVSTDILEYLTGVSRWTISEGLKHLQANDLIVHSTSAGRYATYHIEIILLDKNDEEIDNGMVLFLNNQQYLSTDTTASKEKAMAWLDINPTVVNSPNVTRIVGSSNNKEQPLLETIPTDKQEISTDGERKSTDGERISTIEGQNAYIHSLSVPIGTDTIDKGRLTVSPTDAPAEHPMESPFYNPGNKMVSLKDLDNLRAWQKDVIKLFKEWTGRDFSEDDLKELNKAYAICEPGQIKNAVNFAGQKREEAFKSGGMHYVVAGILSKGMFNKRRPSKGSDASVKTTKELNDKFKDITIE